MDSHKKQRRLQAFHDAIQDEYCGIPLTYIAERAYREQFVEAHDSQAKRARLSGGLARIKARLRQLLTAVPLSRPVPWQSGSLVFLPANQTSAEPMLGLQAGLDHLECPYSMLVPKRAVEWSNWEDQVAPRRPWKQSASPLPPDRGVVEAVERFKQNLALFAKAGAAGDSGGAAIARKSELVAASLLDRICWIETIRHWIRQSRPACFVANRPKGVLPLSYLLAGYLEGVPNVFMPHTILLSQEVFRPAFYDLRLFDLAIVYSRKCRQVALELTPSLTVLLAGWPSVSTGDARISEPSAGQPLKVGYPADVDYAQIRRVAQAAAQAGVSLLVKGHPPGRDQDKLDAAVDLPGHENLQAIAHEKLTLSRFLDQIDLLVCGVSSVGFHAASRGIPVVMYYSREELQKAVGPDRGLRVSDFSEYSAEDGDDLVRHLACVQQMGPDQRRQLVLRQQDRFRTYFDDSDPERLACELLRALSSERGQRRDGDNRRAAPAWQR